MKRIEYKTHDKSSWGPGPWQAEPDKIQYVDNATGMPCLIVRNTLGSLCGYVGVSKDHPFFKKGYNDCDVTVHGGLTFADTCAEDEHGICHLVEEGEDDLVWWLGFDCAHLNDMSPGMRATDAKIGIPRGILEFGIYKDVPYVVRECSRLAKQLMEVKDERKTQEDSISRSG